MVLHLKSGTIASPAGSNGLRTHSSLSAPLNRDGSEVFMFEDSFIVSQLSPVPAAKRWTMAGSAVVQLAIAAALATLPLLHPERLSLHLATPVLVTPPLPKPAVQIVQQRNSASTTGLTPEPNSSSGPSGQNASASPPASRWECCWSLSDRSILLSPALPESKELLSLRR